MTMRKLFLAAVMLASVLAAGPSFAHHSFAAEFDGSNCRDFTGVLPQAFSGNIRLEDYFSRGSSTSRSPSPSRLRPRTTATIATPGTVVTQ